MKKILLPLFSFGVLFFACVPSDEFKPAEANLRTLATYEKELANSSTKFALDLFAQVNDPDEPNQFYSPYSIHQALSMTMNGNEGEVLQEFVDLLRYEGMSLDNANRGSKELTEFLLQVDPKVKLAIANAIWYKQEYQVQVPFKNTARDYYNAEIAGLDMRNSNSVNIINNWIAQKTNNLIKDMLDEIPSDAVMYLVNAIYYKADWKYQFVAYKTKKENFYPSPGNAVQVDMMDLDKPSAFKSYYGDAYHYFEIPYSTGQYSMGILYNQEGNLDQVSQYLNLGNLEMWRQNAQEINFILKMPKFKMKYKMANMKNDLMEMGLVRPFSFHPDNFTKLFSNLTGDLKISRVIHDALIEVDEKGSEAAAATIVEVVELTSAPSGPRTLVLDKPFIFFIQEKHSGAILFMGKLGDPSKL
ncbi:serpin B [Aquiflexum balticum DSM 16537]|uniref:Serpin B n=1 Tax=Aquiflexum balticum DSM 16537 TaxID=758820 RepID=A0A1W2HAP3_9BACT|nr:serpin family protein [Aquiflexum balticum]SMD45636.1 serpin B [Aquiflexum balticum DSM 16537]